MAQSRLAAARAAATPVPVAMTRCRGASRGLAAAALLLALTLAGAPSVYAVTTPSDKAALLDFKDAITNVSGFPPLETLSLAESYITSQKPSAVAHPSCATPVVLQWTHSACSRNSCGSLLAAEYGFPCRTHRVSCRMALDGCAKVFHTLCLQTCWWSATS